MSVWIGVSIAGLCWTLAVLAYRMIPPGVTEENFCDWWREELGNRRLLKHADYVEDLIVNHEAGYNQFGMEQCMIGYAINRMPKLESIRYGMKYFSLNFSEIDELFSSFGCGDAGEDGIAAVRYVRNFVARRRDKWEERAYVKS